MSTEDVSAAGVSAAGVSAAGVSAAGVSAASVGGGLDGGLEISEVSLACGVVRVGRRSGRGVPLLLLTGIGANIEMWAPLVAALPERAILALDIPGTGGSPALRRPMRMPGYAGLVEAVLDELGVTQVDVLGYSWGGALAQELARRAPRRVRALVLAATSPGLGGEPPMPWVMWAMMTPLRYYSPAYLRIVAPVVYGEAVAAGDPHLAARELAPPSAAGYAQQLWAISGWTSRLWLRDLRMPTLVIAGRRDRLTPVRNSRILARSIPGARLVVLEAGHLVLLSRAAEAADVIAAFLDEVDAAQR